MWSDNFHYSSHLRLEVMGYFFAYVKLVLEFNSLKSRYWSLINLKQLVKIWNYLRIQLSWLIKDWSDRKNQLFLKWFNPFKTGECSRLPAILKWDQSH